VTETPDSTSTDASGGAAAKKRAGGLNGMLVADLKAMAAGIGIPGAASMKKPQLVAAIKAAGQPTKRSGGQTAERTDAPAPREDRAPRADRGQDGDDADRRTAGDRDQGKSDSRAENASDGTSDGGQSNQRQNDQRQNDQRQQNQRQSEQRQNEQGKNQGQNEQNQNDQRAAATDDEQGGSRRNRRRRGRGERERTTTTGGGTSRQRNEPDTQILEDDVLVPAAGILDVLDNYAFVRTSGYLPGVDDVYLSLSLVRKFGLRRGDAIVGMVRQPREGERKEKFNPMVRVDAVNGADPETAKNRVEFDNLTALYPHERLRLETGPDNLVGRAIDLTAPIGKGQRGLVVSPAKAGKTTILQSIAGSLTANNPECHLMVVLVDERPEEVTEFERVVKGEVISSTFDRPATDHTTVAELAIERAKRLVELGHDVVVLLDGLTRLGRAYNLSAPASGRTLPSGVDATSLHPPKKFFGAARNVEDGGSLTIIATALVETGSSIDEAIFEELRDTANMELRLRRELADKGLFPAVDSSESRTRREEQMLSEEELAILAKLRAKLSGAEPQAALELLLDRLGKSQTNIELLTRL
jgi:transcription termination factor Rho